MAASMTTDFPIPAAVPAPASASVAASARVQSNRPRRITPQAGRALEILGHAIEYLTDEFVYQGGGIARSGGQLDAVQLLMAVNRQVYFECPETPSLAQRFRAAFHLRAA